MSASPLRDFVVTGTILNATDSTVSVFCSFNRSMSQYTPCVYDFDFSVGSHIIQSVKILENDHRSNFTVTGLPLETTYLVRGQTYCWNLDPAQSKQVELTTFTIPSCLDLTDFNLKICPPPPVSKILAKFNLPSVESGAETSLSLQWTPPVVPINASSPPVDFIYRIRWRKHYKPKDDIRRSNGQMTAKKAEATIKGLPPGYNYTINVSAAVANGQVGWSKGTVQQVPAFSEAIRRTPSPPIDREPITAAAYSWTKDLQKPDFMTTGVGLISMALLLFALIHLIQCGLKCRKRRRLSPISVIEPVSDKVMQEIDRPSTTDNLGYIGIAERGAHLTHGIAQIHLRGPYKGTIPITAMKVKSKIAEGAFGVVKFAYLSIPNVPRLVEVAVKTVKGEGCQEESLALLSEIKLMRQIPSHQSVVSMIGYCISTRSMETCLLLEYCANGDLRSYLLCRPTDLTPSMLLDFSVQIAEGMGHLARYKIVHRDLAARNVLISGEKRAKITDFGLSRATPLYYRKVTPGKVPWKWLAPESLAPIDSCYTSKSDVWSFGVVLHEIFSWGEAPWLQVTEIYQLERLLHPQYGNHRMPKPVGCSNEMYAITMKCWQYLPDDRPNFDDLASELRKIVLRESEKTECARYDVRSNRARNWGCSAMRRSRPDTNIRLETIAEVFEKANLQ